MKTSTCPTCESQTLILLFHVICNSDDQDFVRLMTPPPPPSLNTVLAGWRWKDRVWARLQWWATGKAPDHLVRELHRSEEERWRRWRLWQALLWCERCEDIVLPSNIQDHNAMMAEMKLFLGMREG